MYTFHKAIFIERVKREQYRAMIKGLLKGLILKSAEHIQKGAERVMGGGGLVHF